MECKNIQVRQVQGAKDEFVHLDLYQNKNDKVEFVKHLANYSKIEKTYLEFMLDLGPEFDLFTLEEMKHKLLVIMSITDANNQLANQPNVSIRLDNSEPEYALGKQAGIQYLSTDKFPRNLHAESKQLTNNSIRSLLNFIPLINILDL